MSFQNVIMPDVSIDSMHGVFKLLAIIGTPQAEESAAFLNRLIAEKDAAVAAQAEAAKLRAEAEPFAAAAAKAKADMENNLQFQMDAVKNKQLKVEEAAKSLNAAAADLEVKKSDHAAAVAVHEDQVTTKNLTLLTRENAITAREQKLARDLAELEKKQAAFDEHMAPIVAAAKLASST